MGYSKADFGGAMSELNKLLTQGYNDKKELALKQQQVDFAYPREVRLGAKFLAPTLNKPDFTFSESAANAQALQKVMERSTYDRDAQGRLFETNPTTGERKRIGDASIGDGRMPASEQNLPRASPLAAEQPRQTLAGPDAEARIFAAQAASMGGKYNPEDGSVTFPGHIGMALLGQRDKTSGDIADMYKTVLRPAVAPARDYIPPAPQGRNSAPKDTTAAQIASNDKRMQAIAAKAGVKSDIKGFQSSLIPDPALRNEYQLLQQKNLELRGLGQAAPKRTIDEKTIRNDIGFVKKVKEYMTTHRVGQDQAEQAVIRYIQSK